MVTLAELLLQAKGGSVGVRSSSDLSVLMMPVIVLFLFNEAMLLSNKSSIIVYFGGTRNMTDEYWPSCTSIVAVMTRFL